VAEGLCADLLRQLNDSSGKREGPDTIAAVLQPIREKPFVLFTNENQFGYVLTLTAKGPDFAANESLGFAALAVVLQSEFLQTSGLDKQLYGTMTGTFDPVMGIIAFTSVKNQNPGEVLRVLEEAIGRVAAGDINDDMIARAIIQLITKIDQPVAPSEKGTYEFMFGIDAELLQSQRNRILGITKEEVIAAAIQLRGAETRCTIMGVHQDIIVPTKFEVVDILPGNDGGAVQEPN
jgi:hypothetical protein